MKKSLLIITIFSMIALTQNAFSQTRYLDEVFSGVTVTSDVTYGANVTVITGAPTVDTLKMDVYQPAGDSITTRPLIIYVHTGSFLPYPINGSCTGTKVDSATVAMCMAFAKRGYVAAAITYRMGWNPLAATQIERTDQLLNAAYRGIQDTRGSVRFFRDNVANGGNTYGIDDTKVVVVGQGTGGYVSFGCAHLNKFSELSLLKFLDTTGASVIDTNLSGNWNGIGGVGLNMPNYPNESSAISMAINLGGALGDSSWIEAGEVPTVGFHSVNDPFAPYDYGMVIVPTTGENVVFVSGSKSAIRVNNAAGNNDSLLNRNWTDAYTPKADQDGSGIENLYPIVRPSPESAPWEWWLSSCPNDSTSLLTNPTMSAAKGQAYVDTVQGYIAPRIACVLNIAGGCPAMILGVSEITLENDITVFPNPSSSSVTIKSSQVEITGVELYDVTGRLVFADHSLNTKFYSLERGDLVNGLYFVKVKSEDAEMDMKILFQ